MSQLADEATGTWAETSYAYDGHGNLVTVTDANGAATSYQVDDFGNTVSVSSPVTGLTVSDYDEASNLLWTENAIGTTQTRYLDDAGRVVTASFEDASAATDTVGLFSCARITSRAVSFND